MPNTTITALVEELAFLTLLGNGSTSLGVQESVRRLVMLDPDAPDLLEQAMWMRRRAEERILAQKPDEPKQTDIYKYLSAHFYELVEEWKSARPKS